MKYLLWQRKYRTLLLVLIIIVMTGITGHAEKNGEKIKVHFLDVGQADAILVQLTEGRNMLIDGGNNADGSMVVDYLKKLGIEKLDYLIGTHPHEDHIGGLDNIIRSFKTGTIYMPGVTHTTRTFEDLLLAIKEKEKKIKTAKGGESIIEEEGLEVKILSPLKNSYDELNKYSVVVKLIFANTSFLFTGDAEEENEKELLAGGVDLDSDVLKVAHHGSYSSTTESFLKAVSPEYAVITVGEDNKYGHPSFVVLDRLHKHGVKIFRTDKQGTIVITTDGKEIKINKEEYDFNLEMSSIAGITIEQVNLEKEEVIIYNGSNKEMDISGWKLISVRGNQEFVLPPGTVLPQGEKLTISSGRKAEKAPGKIIWTNSYIWNNDGDGALLRDSSGKIVDKLWRRW